MPNPTQNILHRILQRLPGVPTHTPSIRTMSYNALTQRLPATTLNPKPKTQESHREQRIWQSIYIYIYIPAEYKCRAVAGTSSENPTENGFPPEIPSAPQKLLHTQHEGLAFRVWGLGAESLVHMIHRNKCSSTTCWIGKHGQPGCLVSHRCFPPSSRAQ